jgi:hypothetical protein
MVRMGRRIIDGPEELRRYGTRPYDHEAPPARRDLGHPGGAQKPRLLRVREPRMLTRR